MPAAQWTLGVDAIVKAVGEHSTFIKLVDIVKKILFNINTLEIE